MPSAAWTKAIEASADPERAKRFYALLEEKLGKSDANRIPADRAKLVAILFGGSEALSNSLLAHPEWLPLLQYETLEYPRRQQGLASELAAETESPLRQRNYDPALQAVRAFQQREILRIAVRDLARLSNALEITRELSDLADVCLDVVWKTCLSRLTDKHGKPYHQSPDGKWHETKGCVLGMGKLGGQELNYSSDVDVLFVYEDEGNVFTKPPSAKQSTRAGLSNHQFFCRLAESFIAEVSRISGAGMLYRIDLRLRPEGDSGPLARSIASYENYYAQWGQTWERMMMIKARGVAGDPALAAEFLEMIQPFRYPRTTSQDVLREVAAMKDRIENEVVKEGELDRNVKLGRGGIREIEFTAQSQQLLHAGKLPFLQGSQTVPCLEKLAQYELLEQSDAVKLRDAYRFLRDIEHRLQMESNLQTHTIPADRIAQERLARLMNFKTLRAFKSVHQAHRASVRAIFDKVLRGEANGASARLPFPDTFDGKETTWKEVLGEHGFCDLDKAFRVLREFVEGPGYIHVSTRTRELALKLLPRLMRGRPSTLSPLSDPDRVVTRLDTFIGAYGARSTLFESWNSNPAIFDLLVLLFDRSEFLAELAIRTPDLVDELVTSGRLRQRKTSDETLEDLRHGINDADQYAWIRRYHQAELMRIGLRDILGLADEEQYLVELSALADACLRYAVEVVLVRNAAGRLNGLNELNTAGPFAVIGLGKLGGAEIDYGSDLDILFVAGDIGQKRNGHRGKGRARNGKDLTKLARMAAEVMDLLSKRTEHGIVFHTDARLRPDGEKGLLVNTLKAYQEYYRTRAALWEIQSLTRTRYIAGNPEAGAAFQEMAGRLMNFKASEDVPAAYTPNWKQEIHRMRMRIEKERTPAGKDELAIKTGKGGLVDAEFVAQGLCLENGWREANTLRALQLAEKSKVKSLRSKIQTQKACESNASPGMIAAYRKLRRVEGILRRWSYEGETVLPDDPAPYLRVALRCGFANADEFRSALAAWRNEIRQGYAAFYKPA